MRPKSAIGWSVCLLLLSAILYGAWVAYHFDRRIKAEYTTARVIRIVDEFVANNNGQWPTSWSDLDAALLSESSTDSYHYRKYVIVDFSLTSDELLDNPERIKDAIVPVTGEYRTYPHARRQLEQLLETIHAQRNDGLSMDHSSPFLSPGSPARDSVLWNRARDRRSRMDPTVRLDCQPSERELCC